MHCRGRTEWADENLEEEPGVDRDDSRLARSELAILARVLALEHPVCVVKAREIIDAVITGHHVQHKQRIYGGGRGHTSRIRGESTPGPRS